MNENLREEIMKILVLDPCHTSGEHDPMHTTQRLCGIQKSDMFDTLMAAAGLTPQELPHALHGPDCHVCHNVPRNELDRVEKRKLHAWAGVDVPAELAAPGYGAPQPGDEEAILAELAKPRSEVTDDVNRDGFRSTHYVAVAAACTVFGENVKDRTDERGWRLFTALVFLIDKGEIEHKSGYVRLPGAES